MYTDQICQNSNAMNDLNIIHLLPGNIANLKLAAPIQTPKKILLPRISLGGVDFFQSKNSSGMEIIFYRFLIMQPVGLAVLVVNALPVSRWLIASFKYC